MNLPLVTQRRDGDGRRELERLLHDLLIDWTEPSRRPALREIFDARTPLTYERALGDGTTFYVQVAVWSNERPWPGAVRRWLRRPASDVDPELVICVDTGGERATRPLTASQTVSFDGA